MQVVYTRHSTNGDYLSLYIFFNIAAAFTIRLHRVSNIKSEIQPAKETKIVTEYATPVDEELRLKNISAIKQSLEMTSNIISPDEANIMRLLLYVFFFYRALLRYSSYTIQFID